MKTIELAAFGPVIPVIVINHIDEAIPMAEALLEGGIRVLEVTLRSECALQAIELISTKVPDAIVGAGTLRTVADATNAKIAGSQFAVSPGYTSEMGAICKEINLPLLPGVSTGSEVMMANNDGFDFLKLFPAVAVGGINLLKGFNGPFSNIMFCPTGGVTIDSAPDFLKLPNVPVCGGTWLTPKNLVESKQWNQITRLAKEASSLK
ncbi:MAG: bifunctional 4-hydroxy-2-oxoglutarate aldolase/2-dehydro-3-deoxy-phosphogluconate aldolase [Nitrosomonadales bacterium]|jgi:2-dehydro-3-deoxyphosphogluconate aldolase/(4S)-4-hydroxy-2-oxoglutarate aldolase|nr:MAG: keto-deoxy-phosphogluconate aldolase [Methylophilales bacterium BACL14 MAG-120910-bin43]KRP07780.1 MAG: keto-deoxy-phosphogluconate aldolase [Methylophilales bacterium BACL14 MAG-120920-bin58]MBT6393020.1 bifunctional 4-hydroxy-2-oxoglutarate aldolase/2-dehydro-3-deoxy-phosphogluconate aldolase [Nitrosomonadales bacterium]|tara:strand:+ start:10180 stop:10800 length:621 start_codon:yes stop_codon:yes gene_type:complete